MQHLLFIFMLFSYLPVNASPTENTYGPIRERDRLWDIATRVRPDPSITRYQTMIALLQANPHAFSVSCNLNSLKTGQILHIPSSSEMQQLSPAQAETEYHRQNSAWKAYRRQGKAIDCSSEEQKNLPPQESTEPILSVIKSALAPMTSTIPETKPPVSLEKPLPRITSSVNEETFESPTFPLPFSLLITLAIAFSFLLILPIAWLVHKHIVAKILLKQNRLDSLKDALNQHKTHLKKKKNFSHIASDVNLAEFAKEDSSPPIMPENPEIDTLKEKLAYIRTYLAEGEGKAVEKFLKEVLEEGSPEQQEEAKQLIEINKKMSTLELYIAKNQSLVAHNPLLQEILQVTQHLPTLQYLPENEGKVIDLVDKIFEFLDQELDAQGKLMEAYTHRYKPKFFETNTYSVVRKNEKILTEEELSHVEARLTPKPPRFL